MLFRNSSLNKLLTIFTGVIFLNLSFLLVEVKAIDLENKDRALYETLVRLLSGTGLEEERDGTGESSIELKGDITFYHQIDTSLSINKLFINNKFRDHFASSKLLSSYEEIFSPPPEG